MSSRNDSVIEIHGLTRQFGAKRALDAVTLDVPRGGVFGLVGPNGAGKTTLIKHALGLLRAQTGTVRVFGLDPVQKPAEVLARIGCLAEENDLPSWMRVEELLRYMKAFYPNWSDDYAEKLREAFDLDPKARIQTLSRGQKARAGLLIALAYRPELLILDEPSSGLDPIVRRDILAAVIRTTADEGRTVVFSSHLLDEVERVADRVAMILEGRIVFHASLDELHASHRRITIHFVEPRRHPPTLAGALAWNGGGHEWSAVYVGAIERLRAEAENIGGSLVEEQGVGLDEIFVARAGVLAAREG